MRAGVGVGVGDGLEVGVAEGVDVVPPPQATSKMARIREQHTATILGDRHVKRESICFFSFSISKFGGASPCSGRIAHFNQRFSHHREYDY